MAGKIKGITVEIGGDCSGLERAIKNVNKDLLATQRELKGVETLLNMDPGNMDLLKQKQELLSQAIADTTTKLKQLRAAKEQADKNAQNGTELNAKEYRNLIREISSTESALSKLTAQAKEFSTQDLKIDGLDEAEKELQQLNKRMQQFESAGSEAANEVGSDFQRLESKLSGVGDKLTSIGTTMSGVTAVISAGFAGAVTGTIDYRRDLSRLEINAKSAGVSFEYMAEQLSYAEAVTGETDSSIEALSNLLAAGFDTTNMQQALEGLSGAALKFSDTLKLEGLADGLQETLATGAAVGPFAELLERSGIALEDFDAGLQQAKASGDELNYVLDVMGNIGLYDVNEGWEKSNSSLVEYEEATSKLRSAMANLGNTLTPIMTNIVNKTTSLVTWFNNLDTSIQKIIIGFLGIVSAVGPVLLGLGKISNAIEAVDKNADKFKKIGKKIVQPFSGLPGILSKAVGAAASAISTGLTTAFSAVQPVILGVVKGIGTALSGAFTALLSPIGLVVAAIAVLATGFVLLYQNSETFRNGVQTMLDSLKVAFEPVGVALQELMAAFGELGQAVMPLFSELGSGLLSIFTTLVDAGTQIAATLIPIITQVITAILPIIQSLLPMITTAITTIMTLITTAINAILPLITTIITAIVPLISMAISIIVPLITTAINIITQIIQTITPIIQQVVNFIVPIITIAVNTINAVIQSITTVLQGIINFVQGVFTGDWSQAWEGIKQIFSGVIDAIKAIFEGFGQVVNSIVDAIVGFFESAGTAISEKFSAVGSAITGFMESAAEAVRTAFETAVDKVKAVWDSITTFFSGLVEDIIGVFSSIPERMYEIGANIVQGLINGIRSLWDKATSLASSLGNKVANAVGKGADTHSPSRITEETGEMTGMGLVVGLNKVKDLAVSTAEEIGAETAEAIPAGLTSATEKVLYQVVGSGIAEELAKGIYKGSGKITDQMKEISQNIYSEAEEILDIQQSLGEMSEEQVLQYWQNIRKLTGLQGEELLKVDKKIAESEKAILDEQQRQQEEALQAFESRVDSIAGFAGIFDKVEFEKLSGEELLANLETQTQALEEYGQLMTELAGRGISSALLQELQNQGVGALDEIRALSRLSDEELMEYDTLFGDKMRLAAELAADELGTVTTDMVNNIGNAVDQLNTNAQVVVNQSAENQNLLLDTISTKAAEYVGQALLSGMTSIQNAIVSAMPQQLVLNLDGKKMAQATWGNFDDEGLRRNRMYAPSRQELINVILSTMGNWGGEPTT